MMHRTNRNYYYTSYKVPGIAWIFEIREIPQQFRKYFCLPIVTISNSM